jgi:hypothetical protein
LPLLIPNEKPRDPSAEARAGSSKTAALRSIAIDGMLLFVNECFYGYNGGRISNEWSGGERRKGMKERMR